MNYLIRLSVYEKLVDNQDKTLIATLLTSIPTKETSSASDLKTLVKKKFAFTNTINETITNKGTIIDDEDLINCYSKEIHYEITLSENSGFKKII